MHEFKYTMEYVRQMPACTFQILLEELKKKAEREEAEMKKNSKGGRFR